ncbi:MAG TPA: DUF3800 domain-containing protein [Nitrosomonas sp.]|nr:DUF3800 domain-containing protein [Nitrosomonas sp.]HQX14743.1 DUF3800 domain-containing protein [Nitrosomonas sp.]HRB33108.1 DUF3800 domain-containing protein [Nitrosomonas sp.]HRB46597.1 DUF3800 domain-containing protein [Nitrosomonas sp.]HRB78299.1 DUF3800 domain-containing protein [Nitrosomonas sp.]
MAEFGDYIVFVDESGDHSLTSIDQNYPIFVLAFCIFEKNHYAEDVASSVIKFKFKYFGHDQVILHENEIGKAKGIFSILLNANTRDVFMNDLNVLVEDSKFTVIASAIKKDKLKSIYSDPNNPYNIAMKFGLERVYLQLESLGCQTGITHILFECRGLKEDKDLELEFRRVCDENKTNKKLPFQIILVDKKRNSAGLQLADLIARPIGRHILNPEQENRAYQIIEKKFRRNAQGTVNGWGLKIFP